LVLWWGTLSRTTATRPGGRQFLLKLDARKNESRLTREVGLTPEQQKQILAILDEAQGQYKVVHDVMDPQIEAIRAKTRDKMRALMTPEQKPKLEEFLRKLDEERQTQRTVN